MNQQEKSARLKKYLQSIAPDKLGDPATALNNITPASAGLESIGGHEEVISSQTSGLEKLAAGKTLSHTESFGLEAIIHKVDRPVFFVMKNSFAEPPGIWEHYGSDAIRPKLEKTLAAIGRVELPSGFGFPYGGTAFVVGPGLLMTNRHVAERFASGLGLKGLGFKTNWSAGFNLRKEHTMPEIQDLTVSKVIMIHPYWDMALLKVEGLAVDQPTLELTTRHPDDMHNLDIAVIGYPAQDNRNDLTLQNQIFSGIFGVKRMQPGKLTGTRVHESFGSNVAAATHDASTLAGNSGSAVVDAATGQVVALHFAGFYLDSNFAVPTFELARDQRVVDAGVIFDEISTTTTEWDSRWAIADNMSESIGSSPVVSNDIDSNQPVSAISTTDNNSVSVTLPLTITVSLGGATTVANTLVQKAGTPTDQQLTINASGKTKAHASTLRQSSYLTEAALTCATCCAYTYSSDIDDVKQSAIARLGFDDCQLLTTTETTCFVATDADTVLIAFSGAASTANWLRNLATHTETTHHGSVHSGFLQAFMAISHELQPLADSLGLGHKELILTGHGSGGALAIIAASEWRAKYPIRSIYTYGQPAVGSAEFTESMVAFNHLLYRLVATGDTVPNIPPYLLHTGSPINLGAVPGTNNTSPMLDELEFQQLQQSLQPGSGSSPQLPAIPAHAISHYIEQLQT